MPKPLPRSAIATLILGRAVLGFVIGNSAWRINWWLHGVLLGFIISLPAAFAVRLMYRLYEMSPDVMTVLVLVLGMVIGLLIELFTSVVFKARSS
jgi:ABC-type Mn2+/Zn2+ transport system permease subunit